MSVNGDKNPESRHTRSCRRLIFFAERDVLHYATLLMFQNATGGVPFLPQPLPQPLEVGRDCKEFWSRTLLNAVRGDISSEAEQSLVNLQREIEVVCSMCTLFGQPTTRNRSISALPVCVHFRERKMYGSICLSGIYCFGSVT